MDVNRPFSPLFPVSFSPTSFPLTNWYDFVTAPSVDVNDTVTITMKPVDQLNAAYTDVTVKAEVYGTDTVKKYVTLGSPYWDNGVCKVDITANATRANANVETIIINIHIYDAILRLLRRIQMSGLFINNQLI